MAKFLYVLFLLSLSLIGMDWYVNDSGWMPRTREIDLYFHAPNWVTGELKTCYSVATTAKDEIKSLYCTSAANEQLQELLPKGAVPIEANEVHTFTVKFWGSVITDRDKTWKCERMQESMTCKLQ